MLKNFKLQNLPLSWTLIKYGLVGIVTQLIDVLSYLLLIQLGVHYLIADNINNVLVLGFNFFAHRKFTFGSQQQIQRELGKYILNLLIIYAYSTALLFVFVDVIGMSQLVGKLVQIALVPLINYFLLKRFVYTP